MYVGGVPPTSFPATEIYMNVTYRSLIIINGILDDEEIQRLSFGKVSNPSLELQEKYDFLINVDFNKESYYEDAGTLKMKDLSPNNFTIEPISTNSLGWQTLEDLQNSATDL